MGGANVAAPSHRLKQPRGQCRRNLGLKRHHAPRRAATRNRGHSESRPLPINSIVESFDLAPAQRLDPYEVARIPCAWIDVRRRPWSHAKNRIHGDLAERDEWTLEIRIHRRI